MTTAREALNTVKSRDSLVQRTAKNSVKAQENQGKILSCYQEMN